MLSHRFLGDTKKIATNIKPGLSFKRRTCWTKTERWQQYLHRKETEALWFDKIVHVEYWNLSFSEFLSFVSPKPTRLLVSWLKIHRCCKGSNCQKLYCANTCKGLLCQLIWFQTSPPTQHHHYFTNYWSLHLLIQCTVTLWFWPRYVGTGKGDCKSSSAA